MNFSFLDHSKNKFLFFYAFTLILCICLFLLFSESIKRESIAEQTKNLEETVRKDIVHCYALEGKYPDNLLYLEDHYGLIYDKDSFYIDYLPIGENIFPDFTIIFVGR